MLAESLSLSIEAAAGGTLLVCIVGEDGLAVRASWIPDSLPEAGLPAGGTAGGSIDAIRSGWMVSVAALSFADMDCSSELEESCFFAQLISPSMATHRASAVHRYSTVRPRFIRYLSVDGVWRTVSGILSRSFPEMEQSLRGCNQTERSLVHPCQWRFTSVGGAHFPRC